MAAMEIELENEDRSKFTVEKGENAAFGRGNGFGTDDRTVSRRHVLFEFQPKSADQTEHSVAFEVLGKNPMWVRRHKDGEVRIFRRSEKGEVAAGDWFCVSGKKPSWFRVKNVAAGLGCESEVDQGLESGPELDGLDVSEIDPVKEFGFIVMGHEFDYYPKQMIRDVKKWNWFLEEPRKESDDDDDDEVERKAKKGVQRKRKKGEENDDEEWTGDSESDEEVLAKVRKVKTPKYSTRSKDRNKPQKDTKGGKSSAQKKNSGVDEEGLEDEDEDDETLGGFIVGEELEEVEETDEDEEEDEFVEDDDDEVLDD